MSLPVAHGFRGHAPSQAAASSRRSDVLSFVAAAGVVAVHASVDSFLAPEPGTRAGDHVLRGMASLAVLALAAAVYPRLRPGGRAALSATLGVLALEGAALAIVDARAVGPRGEDWTGFVLLPVGLLLVGQAGLTLWRSRKPGRLRHLRRAGIAVACLLAAYTLVTPVAIATMATHRPRSHVAPVSLGRPHEEVAIRTRDGLELAAWYVPSRNGAAIVTYPSRRGAVDHARMLVRHGYGVLLVDARGYDGSEGDANVFGWDGPRDVSAAVTWLEGRSDVADGRIGGLGLSVGGEVLLTAAASDPRIRAVVSDGAGVRSVREHLLRGPAGWFSLPEAALQTAALAVLSGQSPPPSLADVVPRIAPRRLLLVYAGRGGGGEELTPDYVDGGRVPKPIWRIPNAGHLGGLRARPGEYEERVTGFFDRALLHASVRRGG